VSFLLEEIEERQLLKKDIAKQLEILPHHLSELFAGKRNISARMAVKLEKYCASVPITASVCKWNTTFL
jgi:plasmid maintenance system antidote protein VapI